MHITKIIAAAALLALAPSGASAAALYGGGTAAVAAPGVTVDAGASVSAGASSSASTGAGDWTADANGIGEMDASVSSDTNVTAGAGAGLDAYSASLMASDENIAEVNAVDEGEVSVEYYHPGRLFGLFPVKVRSETTAMLAASGASKIETHMPWWNFFVIGTGDTSSAVDERLSSSSQVSADLKMADDASARERLIAAIVNAHADATASAEASADAR